MDFLYFIFLEKFKNFRISKQILSIQFFFFNSQFFLVVTKIKSGFHSTLFNFLYFCILSLHSRLANLQKSGEEDWKKRVERKTSVVVKGQTVVLRNKENSEDRPSSIVDRLSQIETASESWRGRVGEKDAAQFTVEGKLQKSGEYNLLENIKVDIYFL